MHVHGRTGPAHACTDALALFRDLVAGERKQANLNRFSKEALKWFSKTDEKLNENEPGVKH